MSFTLFNCEFCGKEFSRRTSQLKYNRKVGRPQPRFCSYTCSFSKPKIVSECGNCGVNIEDTIERKFCSRSCNATFNNSIMPKRKRAVWTCIECGEESGYQRKRCPECQSSRKLANNTKAQLRERYPALSDFHSVIREHARRNYNGPLSCHACGYDLHVEIAHIKPVSDFPDETTFEVINSNENLVALDPRCHWEYDNGLLEL